MSIPDPLLLDVLIAGYESCAQAKQDTSAARQAYELADAARRLSICLVLSDEAGTVIIRDGFDSALPQASPGYGLAAALAAAACAQRGTSVALSAGPSSDALDPAMVSGAQSALSAAELERIAEHLCTCCAAVIAVCDSCLSDEMAECIRGPRRVISSVPDLTSGTKGQW